MIRVEDLNDKTVFALTLWGEARNQGPEGIKAVASVILNRVALRADHKGQTNWGNTIRSVCLAPYQFSCWNIDDPNYLKLLSLSNTDVAFQLCSQIADSAMQGALEDNTNDASHYCTTAIAGRVKWARGQIPVAVIGAHSFYNLFGGHHV